MTDPSKAVKVEVEATTFIDWWEFGKLFAHSEHEDQGVFLDGAAQGFQEFYKELQWEYISDWIKENSQSRDDIIQMLEGLTMRVRD